MKKAKMIIKILIIIAAITVIAVGIYFLSTKGLNFPENGAYTQNNIMDEAETYLVPSIIAGVMVVIYMMIRFYKLGVIKIGIQSLLTIVGIEAIIISIVEIANLTINSLFFAILLLAFATTILMLTAVYEKKIKIA